jgi:hypothetical protein
MFNTFFPRKSRRLWENVGKNMLDPGRPQMTIWHMCIECWIPKATNTHSEYVILKAVPLQQWLYEPASMLRYTVHCLSCCVNDYVLTNNGGCEGRHLLGLSNNYNVYIC